MASKKQHSNIPKESAFVKQDNPILHCIAIAIGIGNRNRNRNRNRAVAAIASSFPQQKLDKQ
jgi:hypothetical protein